MNKFAIFAFNGNLMCFIHVLLNALDMDANGKDVKIIMEGEAVKHIKELEESNNPLYKEAKEKRLFDSICKGCSVKMGVLEFNQTTGIPLNGEMSGHPAMNRYIDEGYQIITL
ncbi:MAG: cytoplasmic protein [Epulopiscium sp.]|nr:cytoplasmic protein [Candidatus Epulonipiscium sp.]